MPDWVNQGVQEYQKRFAPQHHLDITELSLIKRSKTTSIEQCKQREAEQIIAAIPKRTMIVALELTGKQLATSELAEQLDQWSHTYPSISLIIGGPDGLDASVLKLANYQWCLSKLTLPHPLVRVMVAEQLYRALSILQNHPYHR